MAEVSASRVPMQMSNSCLVASIQIDLTTDVLARFREDLLGELHSKSVRGLILDLSGIEVMDLSDFENIQATTAMAKIMGVPTVICGLRPGVVSSLVLLGADTDGITATRDLDMAFSLIEALAARAQAGEVDDDEIASNSRL